eukprot:3524214-Amphidinium_carterae.1
MGAFFSSPLSLHGPGVTWGLVGVKNREMLNVERGWRMLNQKCLAGCRTVNAVGVALVYEPCGPPAQERMHRAQHICCIQGGHGRFPA